MKDADFRCPLCGDMIGNPGVWLDELPPERSCVEGATAATDCAQAMERARMRAWLVRELAK